jgi:dimethylglycine dehydrogenase
MISLDQAVAMNPLIDPGHFIGALWRADGGHCDPSGTTHAYVKAARSLGASVERFTRVTALQQRADGTWDVVTDKGTVHAEHVINCAGLWAREIGHMVGIDLPVLAMEHHYLLTEDIPELRGRPQEIVNTTDYAGEIYMRQERGGALIGTYEPHGKIWAPVHTPDDFSMQLLPDEFERLAPYFEVGFEHFPALGRAGIRKAINGPFTFAPDGNPLVGPVRGLRNYWVACAVMAGFSQGGGIGLVLSRWMAEAIPARTSCRWTWRVSASFATPEVRLDQGARRITRGASGSRIRTRNCPAPTARAPLADLLGLCSGRCRDGARISVSRTRSGLHRRACRRSRHPPIDVPSLPDRARGMPGGAPCGRPLRDDQLRQVRNHGPRCRAWLDRVFACRIPDPAGSDSRRC